MENSRTSMIKMGQHISELRKSKGYTQKNLGDILDVSDKTVSKWEKGIVAPDITILSSLAKTLGVSIDEILAGEEEISESNTIEAIDVYSTLTKRKLIKIFMACILFILLCSFLVFRIEDYYSWHVDKIYTSGDISLKGYIVRNNKESKLILNQFYLSNIYDNTKIRSLVIIVKDKDEEIYNEEISFNELTEIKEAFKNQIISIESKTVLDKNDLEIIITPIDNDYESDSYIIKIN